ncbi:nuclear transport factor 2 family protein [Ekhidna sp.]
MKKDLLFTLFICVGFISTVAQNTTETAAKYLDMYTSMKFDEIGEFYSDRTIFDDATMSFFGQGRDYAKRTGREDIIAFLKEGFASLSGIEYEIEKSYGVGVVHFTYGILKYTYSPKIEGEIRSLSMELPLAIVLEIKDGKIVRHQDVADYTEWYKQYQSQIKE